jgi:hypothetical protein
MFYFNFLSFFFLPHKNMCANHRTMKTKTRPITPRWIAQTINFQPAQHERLKRLALVTGKSVALIVRESVNEKINKLVG